MYVGSRSNRSGRKVKLLTVISSLFKTSKGKPMSNDGGKDDKVRVSIYTIQSVIIMVTPSHQGVVAIW